MSQVIQLQQLLGTDKRNPSFTIYRNAETECLHVYYGGDLFEKVPDTRDDPQYKLMVARLYNAGINAVRLKEAFGADRKTMRRWGDALKCTDPEKLIRILQGRQAHRKLTPEIRAFVRMRFPCIYKQNSFSYSKQMRAEIAEVYAEDLSSETLRPLLKELKEKINPITEREGDKRETDCECILEAEAPDNEQNEVLLPVAGEIDIPKCSDTRKGSPVSRVMPERNMRFAHHLGVLIFSSVLLKVEALTTTAGWLVKQWLATLFLGAVNIEQSKLLDFDSLDTMLGRTLLSRRPQREQLEILARTQTADQLFVLNADLVNARSYSDFYYDPHTKHCTTKQLRLLKSWCGSKHLVGKVLEMDFIHSCDGHPVHIAYGDSYKDLRERFIGTINDFRNLQGIDTKRILSVVVDRGIFGQDAFRKIIDDTHLNIVTWEKDYKQGKWDTKEVQGAFVMERCRNRAEDIKKYSFEYMDEVWEKDADMRLLRVRATNPKGRTIELGILTNDKERAAEELIRLMFRRWIQENDFKYLEKHFGINQITSYASVSYEELKNDVEDKQIESGEYKALQKERKALRQPLKQLLFNEHQHPGKSVARQNRIKELTLADQTLTRKIGEAEKEVSRLDYLIDEKYCRLNVSQKRVMDALKLIARNAFYLALQPFKEKYNNYRDDHVLFRNLTRANGLMITRADRVEVQIFPTAHYPPALRKLVEGLFDQLNDKNLCMPDGSGRRINFKLGEKVGIELANLNPTFDPNE